jgi:hypothetical protein
MNESTISYLALIISLLSFVSVWIVLYLIYKDLNKVNKKVNDISKQPDKPGIGIPVSSDEVLKIKTRLDDLEKLWLEMESSGPIIFPYEKEGALPIKEDQGSVVEKTSETPKEVNNMEEVHSQPLESANKNKTTSKSKGNKRIIKRIVKPGRVNVDKIVQTVTS